MEKLNELWLWLDGKKTIVGTVILTVSAFLSQVVGGVWHVDSEWVRQLSDTLDWIGMMFGGAGLVHKANKFSKEKPTQPPQG